VSKVQRRLIIKDSRNANQNILKKLKMPARRKSKLNSPFRSHYALHFLSLREQNFLFSEVAEKIE